MESLARSKATIELGKRIAASLDKRADLTSQWMAHLIAERIESVNGSSGADRAAAQDACVRDILRLWEQRHAAPEGVDLLGDIEPIARTLQSLDPGNEAHRYFPETLDLVRKHKGDEQSDSLALALQVDRISRKLISYFLRSATNEVLANPEFREALELAVNADVELTFDLEVLSLGMDENSNLNSRLERIANDAKLKTAQELEDFARVALSVAKGLRASPTE